MKKTLTLVAVLIIVSCSNYSKHMIKSGDFVIRNGSYNNMTWSEDLEMKRISWFTELTLLFDSIYATIPEESKFLSWFTEDETARLRNCSEKLVTMNYSLDAEKISHQMFKSKLRGYTYEEVSAPNFVKSLKSHPDFSEFSLSLYKVKVFCRVNKSNDKISITFPNFEEVVL